MGKTARKHRKSHEHKHLDPAAKSDKPPGELEKAKTVSAYGVHDGRPLFAHHYQPYADDDLLASPREFVPLSELAPGDCSPFHVMMVLIATGVGPAALVMPFAFLQGGFVMTCVLLLAFGAASLAASIFLVHLGVTHGTYSLHGLATMAFGPHGALAIGVLQLGLSTGLVVTYFSIIFRDLRVMSAHFLHFDFGADGEPLHDQPAGIGSANFLTDRVLFAEVITLVVVVPFCLTSFYYRKLKLSSTLTVIALIAGSTCAMENAHRLHNKNTPAASQGFERDYMVVPSTMPEVFGILGACFAYQHHAFHAFYALRERSIATFAQISLLAMLTSLFIAYGIGIAGYVSFLKLTKSDVLGNYDFDADMSFLAFWIYVPLSVIVAIALEVVVSAHSIQFLTRSNKLRGATAVSREQDVLFRTHHRGSNLEHSSVPETATSTATAGDSSLSLPQGLAWKRYLFTAIVLILIAQLALLSPANVATVLGLTGAFAGLPLLFVFPAACMFKLSSAIGSDDDRGGRLQTHVFPCLSVAFGSVASFACVCSYIVQSVNN